MISQVAHWSKDIEKHGKKVFRKRGFKSLVGDKCLDSFHVADLGMYEQSEAELLDYVDPAEPTDRFGKIIDEDKVNPLTKSITQSQRMRVDELLGRWEEPEIVGEEEASTSTPVPWYCRIIRSSTWANIAHNISYHRRAFRSLQFYNSERCSHTWTMIIRFLSRLGLLIPEMRVSSQRRLCTRG